MLLEPKPPVVPAPPWPNRVLPVELEPKAVLLAVLPKLLPKAVVLLLPKALLFVLAPKPPPDEPPKPVDVLLLVLPKSPPPDEALLLEPKRPLPPVLFPKRPPPVLFDEEPKPADYISKALCVRNGCEQVCNATRGSCSVIVD